MNILVIAAHPDDEVLGCGGTIAKLAQENHNVYIAILGEGITSRSANREQANDKLIENLRDDSKQVAKRLGASDLFQYDLPDNRFDTLPLLDIIKLIENLLERVQPEVIYTHHHGDLNIDHAVLHRAVVTATRPVSGCAVRELYAFEVPSSTDWAFGQFVPVFRPNVFVDIGDTLETKIQAMALYSSEVRSFPHPRSAVALRAIAQSRGSSAGLAASEAFELVRAVR
jgi:LmbE family N-acetylglucosaminyl deacetylase